ncbi:hypothetical protein FISHEDRAFT_69210 [Fistulina hepatica ATCC 64428]|uniref:Uncharacterized protein n=1 Tax=Fistulina hepatica ATCC 64428 TaxID=1128425 RepID=A0A0D7AP22_9AGAR|nr:hypothetical protein FISHEDRAFT_69210 [Fistulina hepatica ATCC 64428]
MPVGIAPGRVRQQATSTTVSGNKVSWQSTKPAAKGLPVRLLTRGVCGMPKNGGVASTAQVEHLRVGGPPNRFPGALLLHLPPMVESVSPAATRQKLPGSRKVPCGGLKPTALDSPPRNNAPLLPGFSPRVTRAVKKARGGSGRFETDLEAYQQGSDSEYDPPSSPTPAGPRKSRKRLANSTPVSANAVALHIAGEQALAPALPPQDQTMAEATDVDESKHEHPKCPLELTGDCEGEPVVAAQPEVHSAALPPQQLGEPLYDEPVKVPVPADRDGMPAFAHLNPHKRDTTDFVEPDIPFIGCPLPSNDGPWPRSTIRRTQLTQNLSDEQVQSVMAHPERYMGLVPLGAGNAFYNSTKGINFPGAAEGACVAVAKTLLVNHEELRVYAPQPKVIKAKSPPFAYPIACILEGATPLLINFLTARQVWSFSRDLAFLAIPFSADNYPWCIGMYIGSAVRSAEDGEAPWAALAAIKQALWCSADFSRVVNQITARKHDWIGLTPLQRLVKATDSFEIIRYEAKLTRNTTPVAHYQLHGAPITDEDDLRKLFVETVRNVTKTVHVGLASLKCTFLFDPCRLCRDPTHPKLDCPLPKTHLWYGTREEDIPQEPETAAFAIAIAAGAQVIGDLAQTSRRNERGGKKTRATRNRGGQGRNA